MRRFLSAVVVLSLSAASLLAGALTLEVGNPAANPEAQAKHAVVLARITACHSPEKTSVTATAEGIINGMRKTIPLKVMTLNSPGTFAVAKEWPSDGDWAIKLVATNPEYQNYATGVVVRTSGDSFNWSSVKRYYHAPSEAEVLASLTEKRDNASASMN